jgi:hypothetical protein
MFSIVLLTLGCGQAERATAPPAQEPADTGSVSSMMDERIISGELQNVDLDANTFTVTSGGAEHVFVFSGTTDVIGAAGAQGLSGREGTQVTVYYREQGDSKIAMTIELQ